jgi:hypothetical protein
MQDGNPDRRKTTGHLGTHSTVEIETFRAGLGRTSKSACRHILVAGSGEDVCRVSRLMGGKILFIENRPETECRHHLDFGHSSICTCQVRKMLFQLHGV